MQTVQYTLPSHWASAFINGDDSGYEQEDLDAIDRFCEYVKEQHDCCFCIDVEEDYYFTSFHDATDFGVLACEVSVFTFDVGA